MCVSYENSKYYQVTKNEIESVNKSNERNESKFVMPKLVR